MADLLDGKLRSIPQQRPPGAASPESVEHVETMIDMALAQTKAWGLEEKVDGIPQVRRHS